MGSLTNELELCSHSNTTMEADENSRKNIRGRTHSFGNRSISRYRSVSPALEGIIGRDDDASRLPSLSPFAKRFHSDLSSLHSNVNEGSFFRDESINELDSSDRNDRSSHDDEGSGIFEGFSLKSYFIGDSDFSEDHSPLPLHRNAVLDGIDVASPTEVTIEDAQWVASSSEESVSEPFLTILPASSPLPPSTSIDGREKDLELTGIDETSVVISHPGARLVEDRTSFLKTFRDLWSQTAIPISFSTNSNSFISLVGGDVRIINESVGYSPLHYPFNLAEYCLHDSNIVIREEEPTSIVAFALDSKHYLDEIRVMRSMPQVSKSLQKDFQDSTIPPSFHGQGINNSEYRLDTANSQNLALNFTPKKSVNGRLNAASEEQTADLVPSKDGSHLCEHLITSPSMQNNYSQVLSAMLPPLDSKAQSNSAAFAFY